jgi:hypothetical protein
LSELIIRPGHNDHRLVDDLLVPGAGVRALRPVIGRLVLDAPLAVAHGEYARAAEASGTPLLIDPLTFLLQDEVADDDAWAKLPFGRTGAISASELSDPAVQRSLVAQVVKFEVDRGATAIIPPYVLVNEDPQWLAVATDLLVRTREYLDEHDIRLPVVPVLALARPGRLAVVPWRSRLDRMVEVATEIDAKRVALAISGTGGPDDGQQRVHLVLSTFHRLAQQGVNVIAWRQGFLGAGATAAGAVGYECGIGLRERCDLRGLQVSRRPGREGSKFSPAAGVFVQPFSRSLRRPVARELLGDRQLRPRLVCDDERCCPRGADSTLENPRRHAVVARAKALAALDRMPSAQWRLNAVAREADSGAVVADLATRVLHSAGRRDRVTSAGLNALAVVADFIRQEAHRVA